MGRIAKYCKEAGYLDAEICFEVAKEVDCPSDCAKLAEEITVALGVVAILASSIATRGRANRLAAEETAALIKRLQQQSGASAGTIKVLEELKGVFEFNSSTDDQYTEELDKLNKGFQDALASGEKTGITIKP